MPFDTVEKDAVAQAKELLKFYVGPDVIAAHDGRWSVDETAKHVGAVPSVSGEKLYSVFEVWGYIYKGQYRMRFTYDMNAGEAFVLIGEEILEDA